MNPAYTSFFTSYLTWKEVTRRKEFFPRLAEVVVIVVLGLHADPNRIRILIITRRKLFKEGEDQHLRCDVRGRV